MLGPLSISLEHYGVSDRHGFLPTQAPLRELTNPYFASWENIARCIPDLMRRMTLRQRVAELPVLSTSPLKSEPEWRRAYVLLSFLTHGYIWGGLRPAEVSDSVLHNIVRLTSADITTCNLNPYARSIILSWPTTSSNLCWSQSLELCTN